MLKKIITLFCYLSLLLTTGCNSKSNSINRPPDFAFVFEHASCGLIFMDILDSNKNLLTQKSPDGKIANTTSLELSNEQMDEIYKKIIEIEFFNYSKIFVVPDEQIRGYQAPSGMQKLTVIADAQTHSVTWTDEILTEPPYMDESNLRELADAILKIIWSSPDYQSLIGCA